MHWPIGQWHIQSTLRDPACSPVQLGGLRKLRVILDRLQIRKWIGPNAEVNVSFISAVRDWKTWFLAYLI